MAKIKTKFDIGDRPLWLSGRSISNKDRSYYITDIFIEKADSYCNVYYNLQDRCGNRQMKRMEVNLFHDKKELLKSIE